MDYNLPVGLYVGIPSIEDLTERAVGKFVMKQLPREAWIDILSCNLGAIRILRWHLPPSIASDLVDRVVADVDEIQQILHGPPSEVPNGLELAMCLALHHGGSLGSVLITEMVKTVARELNAAAWNLNQPGPRWRVAPIPPTPDILAVSKALDLLLVGEYFRAKVLAAPDGRHIVAGVTTHIHRGTRQVVEDYTVPLSTGSG